MNEKQQQLQLDVDVLKDYLGSEALGKIQLLSMLKAQSAELEALKEVKNDIKNTANNK